MNIYDIARLSGVSIATVSRVVNGSDKVSEKTKMKVLSVISEEGYTPNVFAQGLGQGTMHTVGVLVPDISDLYMSESVFHLERRLHAYGYDCLLSCSGFEIGQKEAHIQMLLSKHVDALILVGSTYAGDGINRCDTDYIREAAQQVPVFLINGVVEGENIYCSVNADHDAVYDVVTSLINRGRRRILFLSSSGSYSAQQKLAGYEQALSDAGLPVLGELKIHLSSDRIHYVSDLLLQYSRLEFDAVVAASDAAAVGALKYASIKGLSIPKDLEVVGYNNSTIAVACEPELTSIDNRIAEICSLTIDNVIHVLQTQNAAKSQDTESSPASSEDAVQDHAEPVPQRTVIPCKLMKRSTTDF